MLDSVSYIFKIVLTWHTLCLHILPSFEVRTSYWHNCVFNIDIIYFCCFIVAQLNMGFRS